MKTVLCALALFGALVLATGAAWAQDSQDFRAGFLLIEQPWARASIVKTSALYFTIVNNGQAADRLLGASTPVAEKAELHRETMDNGIMRMRPVDALEIQPGKSATLKPGGLHIMLMGLDHPLKQGEVFPVTLIFEHAGKVDVKVLVQGPASMGPAAQGKERGMPGMQHGDGGRGDMGGMKGMGGAMQPGAEPQGEKPGN